MKAKKWLALGLSVAMTMTVAAALAACGEKKATVTWYSGREVLKTEKVKINSTVSEWTPVKEGSTFVGWYEEASLTTAYKFDTKITEDTGIFAKWLSETYTEDTNVYYAVGSGSGDMKASGWDQTTAQDSLTFTKDTTVTNKNVYTLTMTMYAGDQFQIVHGGSWDGQMGIGAIVGAAQTEDAATTDKDYWTVKDANNEVVFHTDKGFGDDSRGWNIELATGKDGKYKFTLTTYPGQETNNKVEWELVEAIEPLAVTHKMYIRGDQNDNEWAVDAKFKMTESDDKTYWYAFTTVTASQEFKVYNNIGDSWYSSNGDSNMTVETDGTYCVKYTVADNSVVLEKCEYYIIGTFLDGDNAVNYAVKSGVTPKMTSADEGATYTATLTATDVTGNASYSWIKDQGKDGVFAFKVVFGTSIAVKDWYGADGGDNFYVAADTYTVTFTVASGAVTYTAAAAE